MNINKDQSGFTHLLAILVAVVVIAGVGFLVFQRTQNAKQSHQSETTRPAKVSTLVKALPTGLLTAEKIKELAVAENPKSEVLGIQLEMENGLLVFKVKLKSGSLLSFNAETGKKVGETETANKETELEGTASLPADLKPSISFAKARDIARAIFPKSTVVKIELELEDVTLVYSVRFTDKSRVDVDATTGAVVKTKAPKVENKNGSDASVKKSTSTSGGDSSSTSGSTSTTKSDDSTGSSSSTTPTSGSTDTSHSGTDSGTSGSGSTSSGSGSSGGGGTSGGTSGSGTH